MKEEKEDQKKLLCPKAGCFGRSHNLRQPTNENIENCIHNLKLKGLQKETLEAMKRRLYTLSKQCDINNPSFFIKH